MRMIVCLLSSLLLLAAEQYSNQYAGAFFKPM
jgi:hypothetical protein